MLKLKYAWYRIKAWWVCNIPWAKYRFKHWLFSWNQDEEGDIVFSIAKTIHFIKYKEHTIIRFGKYDYKEAPKYLISE